MPVATVCLHRPLTPTIRPQRYAAGTDRKDGEHTPRSRGDRGVTDNPSFLRTEREGHRRRARQQNDCCGDLQSHQISGAKVPSETASCDERPSAGRICGRSPDQVANLPLCFTLVTHGSFKSSLILSDPPMYSSSTYESSSPSSDLLATDHPAVDARIGTRGHDSASGFSVGLIPQLIDVLRILTEGQDLLSRKIRSALLEESNQPFSNVEQDERLQVPAAQPILDGGTTLAETSRIPTSKDAQFDGATTRSNTLGIRCASDSYVDVGETETSPSSKPDFTPVSSLLTVARADRSDDRHFGGSMVRPVASNSVPDEPTALLLHRDYNYFDELDAMLASLPK